MRNGDASVAQFTRHGTTHATSLVNDRGRGGAGRESLGMVGWCARDDVGGFRCGEQG